MKAINSHTSLIANDLIIGYPSQKNPIVVLSHLNINLNHPRLIGIIGKNGVGKSTLLRTLARLQPALKGEIFLNGGKIENITQENWAKNITVVLTDFQTDFIFTVYDIIAMGRHIHTNWLDKLDDNDKEKIMNAIKIMNIQLIAEKKFHLLSDGQKQKVMIARALAQDTPIIMLDEPTVHLDINHAMELFLIFKNLVINHKKTILLTTHEIGLATQLCDEIWLIDQNQIHINSTNKILESKIISKVFDTEYMRFNEKNAVFEYRDLNKNFKV